ncbi:MAG: sigma-54-dependent Fis family transcriptional regulator [Planctomycetes bacterium]|nr:sigma-54-dependent Fis family transcriptional regulator [Planctomycetota bacterium]
MAKKRAKILIVDDEPIERSILEDELRAAGYCVVTAASPLEAEPALSTTFFDVVVSDLRMPGQDGLSFLRRLKKHRTEQGVIVMTAYGTVGTAVEAMKLGAFDYLQKPFTTEELLLKLDRLLQYEQLATENEALKQQLALRSEETRIIGRSEAIRKVLARIHSLASTDSTVLISGESGTGKEMSAKVIHETSHRAAGPFVAVACAALSRELVESELFGHEPGSFTGATKRRLGRFELAHGGTLFLDDVDDIPNEVQVKLLRVLQERTIERLGGEEPISVNVRLISATKVPLSALVARGEFREDLYYRLNVVPVHMPPLRERLDDIPLLVEHFLDRLSAKLGREKLKISQSAIARLQRYRWPGNVRELEHVLEQTVVLNEKNNFDEDDIPELMASDDTTDLVSVALDGVDSIDLLEVMAETERRLVCWALDRSGGNMVRAAEMLDIPRSTLQYKVGKLDEASSLSPPKKNE